jgi:hypothetical protein
MLRFQYRVATVGRARYLSGARRMLRGHNLNFSLAHANGVRTVALLECQQTATGGSLLALATLGQELHADSWH